MKKIILDGEQLCDREMAHAYLQEALGLPEYYGKNLDALYDCLGDIQEDTVVLIFNEDMLRDHLEKYAGALIRTLDDAADENERFHWRIV